MFAGRRPPAVVTAKLQVKKVVSTSNKSVSPRPHTPTHRSTTSNGPSSAQGHKSNGAGAHKTKAKSRLSSPASLSVKPPPSVTRTHSLKRKAPQPMVQFDTDSESDDSSADGGNRPVKKLKHDSKSPRDSTEPTREIFKIGPWTEQDEQDSIMKHGADIANSGMLKAYTPIFHDGEQHVVGLKYPSNCLPERFEIVAPKDNGDYQPLDDIISTIEHICRCYFPEEKSERMLDDITGYVRLLKRAIRDKSFDSFSSVINDFNETVKKAIEDGTIATQVKELPLLDFPLMERIMSQAYSRTVSPKVDLLKKYENGTSNVYGEILPKLATRIFRECNLTSDKVFVDMGSGVGSIVLQAALEVGCESWGIEVMPNPAALGADLLNEFNARCKRWSVVPGKAALIEGDFLASEAIDKALRRADVVLINNKAFLPELNNSVLMKMLDLKEGCKVVSLKSFIPSDWRIRERTAEDPRNLLHVEAKEYFSGCVSWTDIGGPYYIATKDSSRLKKFKEKMRLSEA